MKKIILSLIFISIFSNWVNAAVVNWATITWWSVTWENTLVQWWNHNWENIQNEDCLKYPEKCQANIPNITTWGPNVSMPNLNTDQITTDQTNYVKTIKRLPVTGSKEIMLILLALLIAWWLFFILKPKNKV